MSSLPSEQNKCGSSPCGCQTGMNRRDFVRVTGTGSLALLASELPVMAGPFETADFQKLVPADKKLSPQWVKSLFERGEPTVYRGTELKYIGMPVGGICAGQLYLGGDGRLWLWDIFNQHVGTGDSQYAHPQQPTSPLAEGFVLKVGEKSLALDATGFSDVSFRGQYPVGTVQYKDPAMPVQVTLDAFSPFIPLNTDDSSLPATILRFTLRNASAASVEAILTGTLENAVALHHRQAGQGTRRNAIVKGEGFTFLQLSAESAEKSARRAVTRRRGRTADPRREKRKPSRRGRTKGLWA